MKRLINSGALLILFWTPLILPAQLSPMDAYVAEGLENNLVLRRQQLSYQKSLWALKEARALFLPKISFNATYTLANGGRTLDFPVGDLINPINSTLNQLTETQSFPTNIPNERIQFFPNNFHETKLNFRQALFNSDIYFNYKARESLIEVEEVAREAYRRELTKEIQTAYLSYLQSLEAIRILDETEILLKEVRRVNQKLIQVGKAQREVLLQTDFELSDLEQQRLILREQKISARSYVNFLVNRPLDAPVVADSGLMLPSLTEDLEILEARVMEQRPELRQISKAQEANAWAIRRHQNALLPELGASFETGFQGFGYNFDDDQAYFLAGFSLSWNIFEGGQNKARMQQAKLEQASLINQEAELRQQLFLQLRQAYYATQAAFARKKASQKAGRSAAENFRILKKKYETQQASFLELLQARTQHTRSRLDLNLAHFNYLIKMAELAYASGSTL